MMVVEFSHLLKFVFYIHYYAHELKNNYVLRSGKESYLNPSRDHHKTIHKTDKWTTQLLFTIETGKEKCNR